MSLTKLGRYELIRVLGKGAMGLVYEGRDPNLNRRVAIKTIKVENLSDEAAAEYAVRFRIEAHSAARLQHPNIVSVYDSDSDGDVAFLVMEFIQGDDLKQHLDQGQAYSLESTRGIMEDLLSALDYAHRQGIVHRDIKPANLLIEQSGRVKLTDFGVARIDNTGDATRTQGTMVGTLKYMSPEQVQGRLIDARADIFAAGIVLYQLLTGKRPFDGPTDFSIIQQIVSHMPAAPTASNPRLPPAIDRVVAKSLAKSRDERYATAKDFLAALQAACMEAEDTTVVPPAPPKLPGGVMPTPTSTGASNVLSSGTSGGTSTVTQELELVYWKDVKESAEAGDLQLFIEKFPAGIYVELAHRRLKKLRGEDSSGAGLNADNPTLTGTIVLAPGQLPSSAPSTPYEPTLKLPSGRQPGKTAPSSPAGPHSPGTTTPSASTPEFEETVPPRHAKALETGASAAPGTGQPVAKTIKPTAPNAAGANGTPATATAAPRDSPAQLSPADAAQPGLIPPVEATAQSAAQPGIQPAGQSAPARRPAARGPGGLDDWYVADKPAIISESTKKISSGAKKRAGLKPSHLATATLACALLLGGMVYGLQRLLISPPATLLASAPPDAGVGGATTARGAALETSSTTPVTASPVVPSTTQASTAANSQAVMPTAAVLAAPAIAPATMSGGAGVAGSQMLPATGPAAVGNEAPLKLSPDEARAAKKATLEKEKAAQKTARQALAEAQAAEAAATEAVRRASPAPSAQAAAAVVPAAPIVALNSPNPLNLTSPRQACEERRFLAFELCVAEQCSKRAFTGHPICVERRAMDERRRESDQVRR